MHGLLGDDCSVADEIFRAAMQRLRELGIDGILGDAEPGRDLAVGKIFESAKQQDIPAAWRQSGDLGYVMSLGKLWSCFPKHQVITHLLQKPPDSI